MITNKRWHKSKESSMLTNAWQSFPKVLLSGYLKAYVGLVQNHKDKLKMYFKK